MYRGHPQFLGRRYFRRNIVVRGRGQGYPASATAATVHPAGFDRSASMGMYGSSFQQPRPFDWTYGNAGDLDMYDVPNEFVDEFAYDQSNVLAMAQEGFPPEDVFTPPDYSSYNTGYGDSQYQGSAYQVPRPSVRLQRGRGHGQGRGGGQGVLALPAPASAPRPQAAAARTTSSSLAPNRQSRTAVPSQSSLLPTEEPKDMDEEMPIEMEVEENNVPRYTVSRKRNSSPNSFNIVLRKDSGNATESPIENYEQFERNEKLSSTINDTINDEDSDFVTFKVRKTDLDKDEYAPLRRQLSSDMTVNSSLTDEEVLDSAVIDLCEADKRRRAKLLQRHRQSRYTSRQKERYGER